jgi:hypothetical protein
MKLLLLVWGVSLLAIGSHDSPFWLRTVCWFFGGACLGYYQSLMEKAITENKNP